MGACEGKWKVIFIMREEGKYNGGVVERKVDGEKWMVVEVTR